MPKPIYIISIVLLVAVVAFIIVVSQSGELQQSQKNGLTLADISQNLNIKDYNGSDVKLTQFVGKPLVINTWAVWCPFCVEELRAFAKVQSEFRDQVQIIPINRAEPAERTREYTDMIGITDDLTFLLDPNDSFYRAIGGFSMPETLFVDENGVIVFHKRGPMDITEIRSRISDLLKS